MISWIVELVEDVFGFGPRASRAIDALEAHNDELRAQVRQLEERCADADYMRALYSDVVEDTDSKLQRTWDVLYAPTEGGGE